MKQIKINMSRSKLLFAGITIVVSLLLVYVFFPNIVKNSNQVFFAKGGDGLKNYYGSFYHFAYDTTYLFTSGQNHPYGESVFYCDSQPLFTNTLKFLKQTGIDLSDYFIAITNLLMLFSVVFGALFLYLLLIKLKLPAWYSFMASVCIAFLSPQFDRMGGHFSLSLVFFIPLYLYLLFHFYTSQKYIFSILIGILSFIGLFTHAYFFAFFGFFSFFSISIWVFFNKEKLHLFKTALPHFLVQIILPFVVFHFFENTNINDRTNYPWGFFDTRAFPESVFLPIGRPYARFLHFGYLKWEGMAFIGMVATLFTFVGLARYFKHFRIKTASFLIENPFLNGILWASIIALFFSFAYPFQWYLNGLWNYMGPIKQFRASGRFSWLFFYTINIVAFYLIYFWLKKRKPFFKWVFMVLIGAIAGYDAYYNVLFKESMINQKIPELIDKDNLLPQNKWIHSLDVSKYQAIWPLPYFHIGSEVYWYGQSPASELSAFTISWKTGLPIQSAILSRTSISQSLKSLALVKEPLKSFSIITDYTDTRDFLLVVQKNENLTEFERAYIRYANKLEENDNRAVYELPFNALHEVPKHYTDSLSSIILAITNRESNDFYCSDTNKPFIYESFGNRWPDFEQNQHYKSLPAKKEEIYVDTVLFTATEPLKISFWMNNLDKDLIPRSMIHLQTCEPGGELQSRLRTSIFNFVTFIDNTGWGLVEFNYKPNVPNEQIQISLWNELVTGGTLEIDDVLIRNESQNVCFWNQKFGYINNRFIKH